MKYTILKLLFTFNSIQCRTAGRDMLPVSIMVLIDLLSHRYLGNHYYSLI